MATYLETEEIILSPNEGKPQWQVAFDPARTMPMIAPRRVVLLMRSKRPRRVDAGSSANISDALDAVTLHDREAMYLLLLDRSERVFGVYIVGLGGPAATVISPLTVLRVVLAADPSSVVLVHNHPSGEPHPSPEDIAVTERFVRLLDRFGYTLVDHVIVGSEGHFSFRAAGMLGD